MVCKEVVTVQKIKGKKNSTCHLNLRRALVYPGRWHQREKWDCKDRHQPKGVTYAQQFCIQAWGTLLLIKTWAFESVKAKVSSPGLELMGRDAKVCKLLLLPASLTFFFQYFLGGRILLLILFATACIMSDFSSPQPGFQLEPGSFLCCVGQAKCWNLAGNELEVEQSFPPVCPSLVSVGRILAHSRNRCV